MPPPAQYTQVSDRTIQRMAEKLNKDLFCNKRYYYDIKSIIKLLNQLSRYDRAPNPYNLDWGYGIASIQSVHDIMHKLDTRGTDIQQQVKQGIGASILVFKEDYDIDNKKLIDRILPHKDEQARDDWIQKCVMRRRVFDRTHEAEDYCNDGKVHKTPSCVQYVPNIFLSPNTIRNQIHLHLSPLLIFDPQRPQRLLHLLLKVIGTFG